MKIFLNLMTPLFGVLSEEEIGIDPVTGRLRLAPELMDKIRQYLQVQDPNETKAREYRVKKSIKDLEEDFLLDKRLSFSYSRLL